MRKERETEYTIFLTYNFIANYSQKKIYQVYKITRAAQDETPENFLYFISRN